MVEGLLTVNRTELYELAADSLQRISSNQLPNGLIPATVGRHDNVDFQDGMVWIKDAVRAGKFALDPHFRQHLPALQARAKRLYLSSTHALLALQDQSEQLKRFQERPGSPDRNGYSTIDDRLTPAIKFTADGRIIDEWHHNQPDNWGTLLLSIGKGIEADWPVLRQGKNQAVPLGAILQEIISYVVNLQTERLICRSIWEHGNVWSSYSTRRIVLGGLDQIEQVWPELVADSKRRGYQLKITHDQLVDSAGGLREKVAEHFPADYTDTNGHESAADLASLVALNDTITPEEEKREIMNRGGELENRQGFYRYYGDPYRKGRAEAKWTMGKLIVARQYFLQAIELYQAGKLTEGFRALHHGLDRIVDISVIKSQYGYIPELFEDQGQGGYQPNNNELAWTLGYTVEAAAAGIAAWSKAEQYH